jgi:hypothetical protein
MSVELLERAAQALEPVLGDVVFLGGASIVLWITDPAAKIEAFNGRGHEDFLGSRDFGDMISLIDGREELVGEVQRSEPDLRAYLVSELSRLREHPRFREGISGALRADFASQARAEAVVLPRLGQMVPFTTP